MPGTNNNVITTAVLVLPPETSDFLKPAPLPLSPSKYAHITEMLSKETDDYNEISSIKFSQTHLKKAKINYNLKVNTFTASQETLPKFPWLVFNVAKIPMHKSQTKHYQDREQFIEFTEEYEMSEGDWTIHHVKNEMWKLYFGSLRKKFRETNLDSTSYPQIEALTIEICSIFGVINSQYNKLYQHPEFGVSSSVKPDVTASHWHINNAKDTVTSRISHPIASLLGELISNSNYTWLPHHGESLLPHIVVECKGGSTDKSDVIKLLIEMAMLRDLEERFYQKPRQFTLGFYVRHRTWQVFVLEDSKEAGFKYNAHHVAEFELTEDYLTWLQLGVVMVRLAAYQTSRTLKLVLKSTKELELILEEAAGLWNKQKNENRRKKQITDADEAVKGPAERSKRKMNTDSDSGDEEELVGKTNKGKEPKKAKRSAKKLNSDEDESNGESASDPVIIGKKGKTAKKTDEVNETDSDDEDKKGNKRKKGTKRKRGHERELDKRDDEDEDDTEGPDRKKPRIDQDKIPPKSPTVFHSSGKSSKNRTNPRNQTKGHNRIQDQLLQKENVIYSGDYARVYRCFDEVSGQEIAIKEFDSESRAYSEAGMIRGLPGSGIVKRVRNIITKFNGKTQLWLELLSPLPDYKDLNELKHFMRGFLEALDYMHFQNFIHGDIKHDNVMIDPKTNEVKLIDFECSSEVWPEQTCRYFHGGTVVYYSPERMYDEPQTHKTDVFSAGLVCAEKMYGIRIKSMKARELIIKKVKNRELSGLATEEGVALLQAMLKYDPNERYSADDCLQHPFLNDQMDEAD